MSIAEKEFVKWFMDRFDRVPTEEDDTLKEVFCAAYRIGVQKESAIDIETYQRDHWE